MFKSMMIWFGVLAAAFGLMATPLEELDAAATAAGGSARTAAEAAQAAGQSEAQLLEGFLSWAQGKLSALEEMVAEIGALAEKTSRDADRVRAIALAILQGGEEGLSPMAQAALALAARGSDGAQEALASARNSLEAARDRARAIAYSITAAVAPPTYSEARQHAQTASSLARSAGTAAAQAKDAVAAGDLDRAVTAAIAALRADAGAWKAACLAEAALRGLIEGVHGWRAELEAHGRAIAADRARAMAAAASVEAVRELLESLVSAGAVDLP